MYRHADEQHLQTVFKTVWLPEELQITATVSEGDLYRAPLGPMSTLSSALRLQLWLSGNCTVANLQLTPEMRPVLLGQVVSINRESFLSIPGRRHRCSLPTQDWTLTLSKLVLLNVGIFFLNTNRYLTFNPTPNPNSQVFEHICETTTIFK